MSTQNSRFARTFAASRFTWSRRFTPAAAAGVALRLVAPGRLQMVGRDIALGLVVELEDVTVRVVEAVRRAVSDVAVRPADAVARRLDGADRPLERVLARGAKRQVTHPRLRRLGQLQAVAEVVAPAAQVDGLALARLDLHAEDVDEEREALLRLRRQQLRVPDASEVVHCSTSARRLSRSYESAPASSFSRFTRSRSSRSRAASSTSSTRSCGTTVAPSVSSTTTSP